MLQEGGPWQCPAPGEACGALPSPAALPQFLQGGAPHCCLFFFPMNEHCMQFLLGGGEPPLSSCCPHCAMNMDVKRRQGLFCTWERSKRLGPALGLFYSFVTTKNAPAVLGCNSLPAEEQELVPSPVLG